MMAHVLGSHSLNAFSVDPLTIILPEGFIAKLYIDSLLPVRLEAKRTLQVLDTHHYENFNVYNRKHSIV